VVLVLGTFARIALVFKILCAALLAYLVVAVLVTHQWSSVLNHTIVPHIEPRWRHTTPAPTEHPDNRPDGGAQLGVEAPDVPIRHNDGSRVLVVLVAGSVRHEATTLWEAPSWYLTSAMA
jgi:hypothetical protein